MYGACNVLIDGSKQEVQNYINEIQKHSSARVAKSLYDLQNLLGQGHYVIVDSNEVDSGLSGILIVAKSNKVPIIGVNFGKGDLEIDRTVFNRYYLVEGLYGDN